MKNLKWLLLLPLAGILLSASCKKDRLDQLPPATQDGRRTFGCLVNGKPFVHKYQVEILVRQPYKVITSI